MTEIEVDGFRWRVRKAWLRRRMTAALLEPNPAGAEGVTVSINGDQMEDLIPLVDKATARLLKEKRAMNEKQQHEALWLWNGSSGTFGYRGTRWLVEHTQGVFKCVMVDKYGNQLYFCEEPDQGFAELKMKKIVDEMFKSPETARDLGRVMSNPVDMAAIGSTNDAVGIGTRKSPKTLAVLLWWFAMGRSFPDVDLEVRALRDAEAMGLVTLESVNRITATGIDGSVALQARVTEKGRVLIEAMLRTPMPERVERWEMPG